MKEQKNTPTTYVSKDSAVEVADTKYDVRHVLMHLHIFKNAGTSFDKSLKEIFKEGFFEYDKKDAGGKIDFTEVEEILSDKSKLKVFSSHQTTFPAPVFPRTIFHPVFFLRHPVERIQSCYHFERDVQKLFTDDVSMEQYVRRSLKNPQINACIGVQASKLCDSRYMKSWSKNELNGVVINSALENMQTSKAFGLVERYNDSLELIAFRHKPFFPEFHEPIKAAFENVSAASRDKDKLAYVKDSLMERTYNQLLEQLKPELLIYEHAKTTFNNKFVAFNKLK